MRNGAAVFDLDILKRTARALVGLEEAADARCRGDMREAEQYLEDAQEEEKRSRFMLDAARVIEAEKLAVSIKLDAELAEAAVEETAAIASANPVLAAEAGVRIAALTPQAIEAGQEYTEAREHRERMEHRHEMAQRCEELSRARLEKMRFQYGRIMAGMRNTVREGAERLDQARKSLEEYLETMTPKARQAAGEWFRWEPKEKEPVRPREIHDRLNVTEPVVDTVLEYLYATDPGFRASVDAMRAQLRAGGSEIDVERKAKKNMAGRLCEEIVIRAFLPMGTTIKTQERYTLEDGSYTKIDMTLYGLKEPLILGRGKGARAGDSLAIEVKSGGKQYLLQQLEHMRKQAEGHRQHSLSCVVCTRDIKDLPMEQEKRLRDALRDAGSPIYGMLPRKESLDERCIRYVKAGVKQ